MNTDTYTTAAMIRSRSKLVWRKALFSPSTNTETRQSASTVPAFAFDGLIAAEFDQESAAAAVALLQQLANAQALDKPTVHEARTHQRPYENTPALQKVPPSEWRSLGGYFDYWHWSDRDRFMELDKAIAASRSSQSFGFENNAEMC